MRALAFSNNPVAIAGGDPPVPVPNTVVKPPYVESTWLEAAWEDR